MTFTDEDYPKWKEIAEATRRALHDLHHEVPQCLPGEPEACGGSFAHHTLANLATLRARVDYEIEHLGEKAQPTVHQIYSNVLEMLHGESGCGIPDHQPVPGKDPGRQPEVIP